MNHARLKLGFFLLALLPIGLSIYATRTTGLGISPDSANYLCAAKTINLGLGFVSFTGKPMTSWPPLFPSILAFFQWLGVSPLDAARVLNALVWSSTAVLAGVWVASVARSLPLAVLVNLAIALSPNLLSYSTMLWSESLFILLIMSALFMLVRFLTVPSSVNLVLASVLAGAATQQRYAGGIAVVVGVFCILFLRRDRGFFPRVASAFVYGFIASVPTILWLARNYYVSGTLTGERFPPAFGLGEILRESLSTVGIMFLPWRLLGYAAVAGTLVLLAVLATPLLFYVRYRDNRTLLNSSIVLALFVLAYTIFIVAIATLTNTCCVDRFLGVTFPLLATQGGFLLHALMGRDSGFLGKSFLVVCFVWLAIPATRSVTMAAQYSVSRGDHGMGSFPILKEFAFPEDALVFSNRPEVVWIRTSLRYVQYTPSEGRYASSIRSSTMPAFREDIYKGGDKRNYVVWFHENPNTYLHSLEDIRAEVFLDLVEDRDGVAIFQISGLVTPP